MSTKNFSKFLISFSGIDGSGKTTLARHVTTLLRRHGIKCNYVYGRLEPRLLKPFIFIGRRIFLRNKDMFNDYEDYSNQKRKGIKKHSFLFKIYFYIMVLDYLIQLFLRIKIQLFLGNSIICDRYIFDTVINDFAVDMEYTTNDMKKKIDKFFRFFPKPALAFFIDVPEDIAFKRKNDTPSLKYLEERTAKYRFLASEYDMITLDGSEDLEKIKKLIEKRIFKADSQ
ncbi:dTMP kinase [Methanothermobacter defluvii]|uniref:dTMP kinase n=1 Tax=Methanothermobacter defluvii TaxID=49339 RepID=A0A371NGE3_9EURY|nr:hypothetical protein [Methanothermobacter defluvii]REE28986.1 dTMP kinase [Methanothermobacter defluvii]